MCVQIHSICLRKGVFFKHLGLAGMWKKGDRWADVLTYQPVTTDKNLSSNNKVHMETNASESKDVWSWEQRPPLRLRVPVFSTVNNCECCKQLLWCLTSGLGDTAWGLASIQVFFLWRLWRTSSLEGKLPDWMVHSSWCIQHHLLCFAFCSYVNGYQLYINPSGQETACSSQSTQPNLWERFIKIQTPRFFSSPKKSKSLRVRSLKISFFF